jgi:hypothetical protein
MSLLRRAYNDVEAVRAVIEPALAAAGYRLHAATLAADSVAAARECGGSQCLFLRSPKYSAPPGVWR